VKPERNCGSHGKKDNWIAFSRWRIERMFEDTKDELGLDHLEVRRKVAIQRRLILTCVSHLFLAQSTIANCNSTIRPEGAIRRQPKVCR